MKRIILIGFMGSGKTTLGRQIASHLNVDFLDTDELIEQKTSALISEIFADKGEKAFRELENQLINEVSNQAEFVLSVGGGLPLIPGMMDRLNALGETIFLNVSLDELIRRLDNERENRPMLESKTEDEYKNLIQELYAKRIHTYNHAKHVVTSDNMSLFDVLKELSLV